MLLSCARDGTEVVATAAAATAQAYFLWSPSLEALRARAPAYMPERVCGVSDKGPLITGGPRGWWERSRDPALISGHLRGRAQQTGIARQLARSKAGVFLRKDRRNYHDASQA